MTLLIVAASIFFIIIALSYFLYISLVKARNNVDRELSDIDVQLRRRLDSIPSLLKIARKFMSHEKELIEEVTKLRTEAVNTPCKKNPEKGFELNNQITKKMGGLAISMENYPELRSNTTVEKAMHEISLVEEDIASSRRLYNSAVLALNNKVDIFPSSVIASMVSIKRRPLYEDESPAEIKKTIDVSDHL